MNTPPMPGQMCVRVFVSMCVLCVYVCVCAQNHTSMHWPVTCEGSSKLSQALVIFWPRSAASAYLEPVRPYRGHLHHFTECRASLLRVAGAQAAWQQYQH